MSAWRYHKYLRLWRHKPKADYSKPTATVLVNVKRRMVMFVVMPIKHNYDIVLLCVDSGVLVEADPDWLESNFNTVC